MTQYLFGRLCLGFFLFLLVFLFLWQDKTMTDELYLRCTMTGRVSCNVVQRVFIFLMAGTLLLQWQTAVSPFTQNFSALKMFWHQKNSSTFWNIQNCLGPNIFWALILLGPKIFCWGIPPLTLQCQRLSILYIMEIEERNLLWKTTNKKVFLTCL